MTPPRHKKAAAPPPEPDDDVADVDRAALADDSGNAGDAGADGDGTVVSHPDGYYWLSPDGRQQFGPFACAEEAWADLLRAGEGDLEPGESLLEAEQEIGIADWLDPDTGEPAEGTSTRLGEDS